MTAQILNGLSFPDYVRTDLAYQDVTLYPNESPGNLWSERVPGDYFVVPFYFQFSVIASATVSNRSMYWRLSNIDGSDFLTIPGAMTQTAGQIINYRWIGGASTSYISMSGSESVAPMPSMIVEPGMTMSLFATGLQAGDIISNLKLISVRVPTGPSLANDRQNGSAPSFAVPLAL